METDANLEARFYPTLKPDDTAASMLTDPLSAYDTIYGLAASDVEA